MKKLLLSSENFTPYIKPHVERLTGKPVEGLRISYIPNAGTSMKKEKAFMCYQALEQFTMEHLAYLRVVDLEQMPYGRIKLALESSDMIVLGGGYVSALIEAIDKSNTRELFNELAESGLPFYGVSAGSMIMGSSNYFAAKYIGEEDPNIDGKEPLSWVPFEVYPHYTDTLGPSVAAILPEHVQAYCIKDNEALVVEGDKVSTVGEPVALHF